MIMNPKEQFLRRYLDITDIDTLHLMTEAHNSQDKLLVAITSKLYEKILEKYDNIDFSTISRSRGDITKIEKYDSLAECVEIINRLVVEYKQDTYPVDIVSSAIANIKSRTTMFKKAFAINVPIAVMTYNTMVLSIVEAVSFLISTCVEYVKDPKTESFVMALNTVAYHNTRQNLLFESLESFNEGCKTGEFDEAMKLAMSRSSVRESRVEIKYDNPFVDPREIETDNKEVVIHDEKEDLKEAFDWNKMMDNSLIVGKVFYFFARLLVPAIRQVVYFYYSKKQKISDNYYAQATLIEMNAYQLQYNNNIDPDKKKKIFEKQMAIAEKYRAKANKYNIDYTVAKKSTERMIDSEDRMYRASDFNDTYSYNSGSILF